jgi:hypothetical protein
LARLQSTEILLQIVNFERYSRLKCHEHTKGRITRNHINYTMEDELFEAEFEEEDLEEDDLLADDDDDDWGDDEEDEEDDEDWDDEDLGLDDENWDAEKSEI